MASGCARTSVPFHRDRLQQHRRIRLAIGLVRRNHPRGSGCQSPARRRTFRGPRRRRDFQAAQPPLAAQRLAQAKPLSVMPAPWLPAAWRPVLGEVPALAGGPRIRRRSQRSVRCTNCRSSSDFDPNNQTGGGPQARTAKDAVGRGRPARRVHECVTVVQLVVQELRGLRAAPRGQWRRSRPNRAARQWRGIAPLPRTTRPSPRASRRFAWG